MNAISVRGIPFGTTEKDLVDLFNNYKITSIRFNKRGYQAFLTFADAVDAAEAIEVLDRQEFNGRILRIEWAKKSVSPSRDSSPPRRNPSRGRSERHRDEYSPREHSKRGREFSPPRRNPSRECSERYRDEHSPRRNPSRRCSERRSDGWCSGKKRYYEMASNGDITDRDITNRVIISSKDRPKFTNETIEHLFPDGRPSRSAIDHETQWGEHLAEHYPPPLTVAYSEGYVYVVFLKDDPKVIEIYNDWENLQALPREDNSKKAYSYGNNDFPAGPSRLCTYNEWLDEWLGK
jgi:hypothetical protein